jgi:ATP-binding cassette subfamily B protein
VSFADLGGRAGGGVLGNQGERGEDIFQAFDPRIIRRFLAFLKPYPTELWRVAIAVAIFVVTNVSIPIFIRFAADSATAAGGGFPFDLVVLGFLVLIAANAVTSFIQEWMAATLAQRVIFDLRRAMFVHLQNVSASFVEQTQVGRIMARIQGDVNSLQEFVETSIQAIGDFFLLIGIVIVLLWMDWLLGLLTLAVLPAMILIRALWLPHAKATFRKARDAWSAQIMVPTVDILTGICQAVVVIVGGSAVLSGRLGIGVMIAFIFYVQRFFDPLRTLSLQYTVMQRAMAAGYRIFEVLDVPVTIADKANAVELRDAVPSVSFKNVTFGYRAGHPVLHNLTFDAKPQQVVALVGPTGSGKTSITALAHRFYDVWEGEVRVGGYDVREVTQESLGRTISMVLQEPFLFTGTVFENIRYNSHWATREDVVAAAEAVHAHDFITALPHGYDTQLGQRGLNLSIGQRQLLSFARALVANPRILILDEATASIDSFTEKRIQEALKVLLEGRTCLVIAHRLATVRDADVIIVLQKGRIVEEGTHAELLATGGLYAHLYSRNYSSFDDLPEPDGADDGMEGPGTEPASDDQQSHTAPPERGVGQP